MTLQEALSHRLDEIEKEERTLKETKLTCQKALKSKLDITSIDQLEIEEEKEEWQVRLAILLKEDIVQKKLSRDEMNNEIACFFIAGTILSVISIWLLPKDYIGTHLYVGLISLAAVVGLLIIGTCSANMKVHLTLLLLGAVVQPVGFFTIGTWTLANADWGKYNRYHAVYTSNKMINVFATIFNAAGYYSGKNWRR